MDGGIITIVFQVAILIMSVVVHEVSHGLTAYAMGDSTAKYAGRLTLNPIRHLDPIGSIVVPFITVLIGGFVFGWAKPVPYNPYNLSNQKWGPGLVAAAGPLSNILLATIFGTIVRLSGFFPPEIVATYINLFVLIVFINIILAVFNLVPIPPLDGSKVLFSVLPYQYMYIQEMLERYGYILLLVFIFFFFDILHPVINVLFGLLTGFSL